MLTRYFLLSLLLGMIPAALAFALATSQARPVELVVAAGDASVTAGIGTRCWSGGECFAWGNALTPRFALIAQGQPTLTARARSLEKVVSATAWPVTGEELRIDFSQSNRLVWPGPTGKIHNLPANVEGDVLRVAANLEPGLYIVHLNLSFEN